ncbi:unnamed protein product [Gongylonema pulchrum]|uniref:FH2 domain-containing protein n=1 Tax=Gongylonema pulchrum TaxID=637853 RepID=A0A183EMR8_9BILA|nr:unnamed protein product [Gongylonema pulchrum]
MVVLEAKKLETEKEVRVVLPEEKYLAGLEKIIVRDYFPELPKLRAQKEYLDAVASNDLTKIRELQLRYSTRRTDRRTSPVVHTPAEFDPSTPGPSLAHTESQVGRESDAKTSVDKHPKYTSVMYVIAEEEGWRRKAYSGFLSEQVHKRG